MLSLDPKGSDRDEWFVPVIG